MLLPGRCPSRSGALLAVVITVLAWASAFVAIRAVGAHYEPGPLALGRLLVGTLALGVSVLVSRRWVRPNRREWLLIAVAGVAWFAAYNVALNAAEQRVDAGTTAMLVNVGPILIALFAGLLLGEGFPRWLVIGALVAFSGAVLVGRPRRRARRTSGGRCSAWSRPSPTRSGCSRRSPLYVDCPRCRSRSCPARSGPSSACRSRPGWWRGRRRARRGHRVAGLPRYRAHRAGVQHVGLRAGPHGCRAPRREHLRRAADHHRPRRGPAGRGATGAGRRRRGDLPGRRRACRAAASSGSPICSGSSRSVALSARTDAQVGDLGVRGERRVGSAAGDVVDQAAGAVAAAPRHHRGEDQHRRRDHGQYPAADGQRRS